MDSDHFCIFVSLTDAVFVSGNGNEVADEAVRAGVGRTCSEKSAVEELVMFHEDKVFSEVLIEELFEFFFPAVFDHEACASAFD